MTQEIKVLVVTLFVTVIIFAGGIFFLSSSSNQSSVESSTDQKRLVRENSNTISSDSVRVTIVEFSDFQCPACKAAYLVTKEIVKEYKGKVNFVYRHFPLPQHKHAVIAAKTAEAAGAQGKFFDMHDKLFENQKVWSESRDPMEHFLQYAKGLGLDTEKFKDDIQKNTFEDRIYQDKSDGRYLGVDSTPTFFINAEKLSGMLSFSDFKEKIEKQLSASKE